MGEFTARNDKPRPTTLFIIEILVLLEGDAIVEGLGAFVTLGQEVEADTTDVLPGTEGLGVVDLVALDFELHQAKPLQSHLVTTTKMAPYGVRHAHHQAFEYASAEARPSGCLFKEAAAVYCLVMNGYRLVLTIVLQGGFGLFLDSVFHTFADLGTKVRFCEQTSKQIRELFIGNRKISHHEAQWPMS